jgi:hypothetical protein
MNRMFTVGLRGLRSNATTLLAARRTPSSGEIMPMILEIYWLSKER